METDDIHLWVQANRYATWFLVGFCGLIGILFTWGGIWGVLGRSDMESLVPLVIGVFCLALTERLARHYWLPRMTVARDKLVVRPFWGRAVVWPYDDVARWGTRMQRIERDWTGRRMAFPLTIEHLERTDSAGMRRSVVLPRYAGGNHAMLNALAERSGIAVGAASPHD